MKDYEIVTTKKITLLVFLITIIGLIFIFYWNKEASKIDDIKENSSIIHSNDAPSTGMKWFANIDSVSRAC